ncbi:MAG TPA: CocE/NonD family hydrolase [Thermoleophilaceae bacterium]|nr:CocE/NonD family hydrolase [Thermoleophilaceae bacterium]
MRRWMVAALALCLVALAAPAAASAEVKPFGTLECTAQQGVRYCPGSVDTRIKSFDGVPLDVNVALPAEGDTGLPLVVQLHGYGGSKGDLREMRSWALRGYAVVNYSARGFGHSCGSASSREADPVGCARGWIHLADVRYEARDTQHLAGLLADQGIVAPKRIGVTGGSYGGGQSLQLATLRDRIMNPDGSFSPWRSPAGKAMRIAAAAPLIPWSDLVYSLTPNGRTLDYTVTPLDGPWSNREPLGVQKQSYQAILYGGGALTGFYAPRGADPGADVSTWNDVISAGDPVDPAQGKAIADEIALHHSAYYLPMDRRPAPLLIANGFTDDLFPADEALRYYNRVRSLFPRFPISLQLFDFGHPRGQNKAPERDQLGAAIAAWFDHYVKGEAAEPARDVRAYTQTCPKSAPSGGPFTAADWESLHPGEVRARFRAARSIDSNAGDPAVGKAVDPIEGREACATTPSADLGGTATYRLAPAAGDGYTLLGSPTVIGRFEVSNERHPDSAQVAARLWDVAPNGGPQTLVARGLYRPVGSGREVFQLHANGWRFEPGHQAKLELLGNDAPYGRKSNGSFQITARDVQLRLPVVERPGEGAGAVREPARLVAPRGVRLAPDVARLHLKVRHPARHHGCRWQAARLEVAGQGLENVRRVRFALGGRWLRSDSSAPFRAWLTRRQARRAGASGVSAVVTLETGRKLGLEAELRSCG